MAPDFERLARIPWPMASLASSGIKAFSSALDRSCSKKACRVVRKRPANSAQEFDALISTVRTASIRGIGGNLDPFAATGDDRKHCRPRGYHPHVVLQLRHVFLGGRFIRE